jgi:gamma-glutamylcyclotransferase (GGCT)/AIG2-like uncharacterized protein YtfP
VSSDYQKWATANFQSGTASLQPGQPESLRDGFRNLWEAYENFLDGMPVLPGSTIRDRYKAFEGLLVQRDLVPHFVERVLRLPEAGLLADLQPRIFREQTFQRTRERRTDEHDAYASDFDRIRSGRRPKEPLARLLNLLAVVRNNLQHGQKILPDEWPEMRERNLEIFRIAAPIQHRVVLSLFETLWADGLFAYGTLRPVSTRFDLVRDLVKTTTETYYVSGKLYDLGEYPALVLGAGDRVPGEILRSDRLHELVLRVDGIEGNDFARRLCWATSLGGGERALAWVYEYRGPTSGVPRCRQGVWPRPAEGGA